MKTHTQTIAAGPLPSAGGLTDRHRGARNRVRLVHWNRAEAPQRAAWLMKAGFAVDATLPSGPAFLKALRADPPGAVVVDLSRIPSHGRDLALALRYQKSTRTIPLVFVAGEPEKVARVKELLPDAVFTSWSRIRGVLRRAIAHPPTRPFTPPSLMESYVGRPLVQKLGIKSGMTVALVNPPTGFRTGLGELPPEVQFTDEATQPRSLTIWFARSQAELQEQMRRMVEQAEQGPVWIAWPKQASKVPSDLTQQRVRETGLAAGLVDYKICSIDATWSGLLFAKRRPRQARPK